MAKTTVVTDGASVITWELEHTETRESAGDCDVSIFPRGGVVDISQIIEKGIAGFYPKSARLLAAALVRAADAIENDISGRPDPRAWRTPPSTINYRVDNPTPWPAMT